MSENVLFANVHGDVCGCSMESCQKDVRERPKKGAAGSMMFTVECRQCGREFKIGPVYVDDAMEWLGLGGPRRKVQDVFPYLEPWERECIKMQECRKCQRKMYPQWFK